MQNVFSFELGKPSTLWSIHVKCMWNYFPVERKTAILKTHIVSRQSLKDSKSVYTAGENQLGKTHIRGLLSRLSIAQVYSLRCEDGWDTGLTSSLISLPATDSAAPMSSCYSEEMHHIL